VRLDLDRHFTGTAPERTLFLRLDNLQLSIAGSPLPGMQASRQQQCRQPSSTPALAAMVRTQRMVRHPGTVVLQ